MKPILFNTEMVKGLLSGQKTVTRRVVKLKYSNTHLEMFTNKYGTRLIEKQNEEPGVTTIMNLDGTTTHKLLAYIEKTPPYCPGDILYVRETWCENGNYELYPWETKPYWYKADWPDREAGPLPEWFFGWRPSIHMPKEAARLFLRVTDVRVERLQDITILGAIAEGIPEGYMPVFKDCVGIYPSDHLEDLWGPEQEEQARRQVAECYGPLWNDTVKPKDRPFYGWDANPWVWVIEFERISKEEAFA